MTHGSEHAAAAPDDGTAHAVPRLDWIVPAAGASSRMGRWKPALEIDGEPMLRRVVRQAARFARRVVVVAGYRGDEVAALLAGLGDEGAPREAGRPVPIAVIHNAGWERGMVGSVQCGLHHLAGTSAEASGAIVIMMGDMPFVPDREIMRVLATEVPPGGWVRPFFAGRPGHPVVIDVALVPAAMGLPPDAAGVRAALAGAPGVRIESSDRGVIRDVDRPGA